FTILGRLERRKHDAFADKLTIQSRRTERRCLSKPDCAGRQEEILPQRRKPSAARDVRRTEGADRQLPSMGSMLLRVWRGDGPAGVTRASGQVRTRQLVNSAKERHQQLAVRRELVLEESGGENGEAARMRSVGDEAMRGCRGDGCLRRVPMDSRLKRLPYGHTERCPRYGGATLEPGWESEAQTMVGCTIVHLDGHAKRRRSVMDR